MQLNTGYVISLNISGLKYYRYYNCIDLFSSIYLFKWNHWINIWLRLKSLLQIICYKIVSTLASSMPEIGASGLSNTKKAAKLAV